MNSVFEKGRHVDSVDDCFFYHRMELPQAGEVGSSWEIRHCVDAYLGEVDFKGQRTLDVGAASGFLTFEMEKRGADVVSFDMPDADSWNIVPNVRMQSTWEQFMEGKRDSHRQLQNAYWFAHQQLESHAKVYYGDVYNLPAELGCFDVAFLGMILGHLRDPFQALYSASRLCEKQIVVTNQEIKDSRWRKKTGQAFFMPTLENEVNDAWWALSNSCIEQMLGVLGFEVVRRVSSNPQCVVEGRLGEESCVSIVANRVEGEAVGVDRKF